MPALQAQPAHRPEPEVEELGATRRGRDQALKTPTDTFGDGLSSRPLLRMSEGGAGGGWMLPSCGLFLEAAGARRNKAGRSYRFEVFHKLVLCLVVFLSSLVCMWLAVWRRGAEFTVHWYY